MSVIEIEKKRSEILQDLVYCNTSRQKLFVLSDYFKMLSGEENPALLEAYSIEFTEVYLSALASYSPMYLHPSVTEGILHQINQLLSIKAFSSNQEILRKYFYDINDKLNNLKQYLEGTSGSSESAKLCFPVLEIQEHTSRKFRAGLLETVTIKISKGRRQDKFIIIPLTGNPEEKLSEQIRVSWNLALQYVKQHIRRVDKYHEVIIHFDGRLGNYVGYSLGLTLTIGFIEELLRYFNAPYLVNVKESIALTGGISSDGKVLAVGNDTITEKVTTVFYSGINTFIIPRKDEQAAEEILSQLQNEFPLKSLELVTVTNIKDLLDRRSLINIKKQNPAIRTAKAAARNIPLFIMSLLMIVVLSYFALRDYDDNPWMIEHKGEFLHVNNKYGKNIWTKKVVLQKQMEAGYRIVDINNDHINEVLLTNEKFELWEENSEIDRLVCLSKNQEIIWKHWFDAVITCARENLNNEYGSSQIIDIKVENNRQVVYLRSSHRDSYPAAIYKLDLLTGKPLADTLWHAGHIGAALIRDYDKDGRDEIVFIFINNSFERCGIGSIETDKMSGMAPCTDSYKITGTAPAEMEHYILLPRTDYNKIIPFARNNGIDPVLRCFDHESKLSVLTLEDQIGNLGIGYNIAFNFKDIEVCIGNPMRVARDSLVAHGILNKPYTDTQEYRDLLLSQVLFWNGKTFEKLKP